MAARQLGKWQEKRDRTSGQIYYVNKETGESQWEPPPPDTSAEINCGICLDVIEVSILQFWA